MNLLVQWNGNNFMNENKIDIEDDTEKNEEDSW